MYEQLLEENDKKAKTIQGLMEENKHIEDKITEKKEVID